MELPITSIVVALLALIMIPLTVQVSLRRIALGKAKNDITAFVFGDAGDEILRRRTRAFGNFIEYVPVCAILLALLEVAHAPPLLVLAMGITLVFSRCLHAYGMLYSSNPAFRGFAMFLTYVMLLGMASSLLIRYVSLTV